MQKFIKKKIGKEVHNFVVEGSDLFEVMQQAGKLSFPDVHACGLCDSYSLELGSHIAQKKFKYVTIKCRNCRASLNFGQQIEDTEVFYLRKKNVGGAKILDWEPFQPKQQ